MLLLLLLSVILLSSKVEGIKSGVYLNPYWYCCPPTCALADTANVTRPVKARDKDNHPLPSDYQPSIPTLSSSPEPASTGLSTRKKIVLGVIVSVISLLLELLIYWRIRRRSKPVKEEPRADEMSPAAAPGYEKPELQGIGICELAAASLPELNPDNIHEASTGAMASELHPTHLLEMDASNLQELDAISPSTKPAEERLEAMQNPTNRF
ncbi:MAG: hypothetical protein Q9199_002519 [Rusavskia elegans]